MVAVAQAAVHTSEEALVACQTWEAVHQEHLEEEACQDEVVPHPSEEAQEVPASSEEVAPLAVVHKVEAFQGLPSASPLEEVASPALGERTQVAGLLASSVRVVSCPEEEAREVACSWEDLDIPAEEAPVDELQAWEVQAEPGRSQDPLSPVEREACSFEAASCRGTALLLL